MKPSIFFYSFILMLTSCSVKSPPENTVSVESDFSLADYECITKQIKFESEGIVYDGVLMFVSYSYKEMPLDLTNVYLLSKEHQNVQLLGDTAAFIGLYDISVSDDFLYLAVFFVAEGHPWIEIYDLQALINSGDKKLLAELNPYPGVINMVGWEGKKLLVESDVNLLHKNLNKQIYESDMFETNKRFYFDMTNKLFQQKR